jgi:hypothetical protein
VHPKVLLEPQQEFNPGQTVEPKVAVERTLQSDDLQAWLGTMQLSA